MTDTAIKIETVKMGNDRQDPTCDLTNGHEPTTRDVAVYALRGALDGAAPAHEAVDALIVAASLRVQTDTNLQQRLRVLEEWRAGVQDTRATEDVVFWRARALKVERQNADLRQQASERESELRRLTATVDELTATANECQQQVSVLSAQLTERDQRISELADESDGLFARVDELESAIGQHQAEKDDLQHKLNLAMELSV